MTRTIVAEKLRARGYDEHFIECFADVCGKEYAEGRTEGAARLLVRMLDRKFESVPAEVRARIDTAPLEQLDIWSERVLDATTLDETFD